jgi:hypothetical protein
MPFIIFGLINMFLSYKKREDHTYFSQGVMLINQKTLWNLLYEGVISIGKKTIPSIK